MIHKINEKALSFIPVEKLEVEAVEQIKNTSRLPFLFRHVAVMPDAHYGQGSTVGTVLPTRGAICPAAVGVDIGCGMIAVKTNLKRSQIKDLHALRLGIERRIPMSAGKFNQKVTPSAQKRISELQKMPGIETAERLSQNWKEQLGTLGGGNHFIELCVDEEETIWATLHSGSRGVGNKIGQHYIAEAQKLCASMFIELPDKDLAYLPEDSAIFREYIRDLRWAQHFALLNREEMMDRFLAELADQTLGSYTRAKDLEVERINCHHNFTQLERHFGKDVWITRKGAIQAKIGMKGMIPGSMGTASYIVSGLQNIPSFHSAPHGAGRAMSRTAAAAKFTIEDFDKAMEGIEHRRDQGLIDEIPGAYKDIHETIEYAKELVKVEAKLTQILNCKGD